MFKKVFQLYFDKPLTFNLFCVSRALAIKITLAVDSSLVIMKSKHLNINDRTTRDSRFSQQWISRLRSWMWNNIVWKTVLTRISSCIPTHWGDQDVDGRIILRWIFRKCEGVVGTGWSWLRIGTGGGRLWVRWWTFGFHKMRGISWLAVKPVSFSRRTLLYGVSK